MAEKATFIWEQHKVIDIDQLFTKAKETKNLKALHHLKDAAIHLQKYEIASDIKKEISILEIPESILLFENDEIQALVTKHKIVFQGSTEKLKQHFEGFIINYDQYVSIKNAIEKLNS